MMASYAKATAAKDDRIGLTDESGQITDVSEEMTIMVLLSTINCQLSTNIQLPRLYRHQCLSNFLNRFLTNFVGAYVDQGLILY